MSENALSHNSSLFTKNNARNINYMAVLVFHKCLDLRKMSILGQPPRVRFLPCWHPVDRDLKLLDRIRDYVFITWLWTKYL